MSPTLAAMDHPARASSSSDGWFLLASLCVAHRAPLGCCASQRITHRRSLLLTNSRISETSPWLVYGSCVPSPDSNQVCVPPGLPLGSGGSEASRTPLSLCLLSCVADVTDDTPIITQVSSGVSAVSAGAPLDATLAALARDPGHGEARVRLGVHGAQGAGDGTIGVVSATTCGAHAFHDLAGTAVTSLPATRARSLRVMP
jgi:hypothetical protein